MLRLAFRGASNSNYTGYQSALIAHRLVFPIMLLAVLLPSDTTASSCGWCRGKPPPDCRSFWVLESGWNLRQQGNNVRETKEDFLFVADFGYMRNVSSRSAIGGTAYVGADDDGALYGLRARYRFWLHRWFALDISPGILLAGQDNYMEPQFPGFVGSVSLGFGDWFALKTQFQAIKFKNLSYITWDPFPNDVEHFVSEGTQTAWYIGIQFGSYAAVAFPVVLLVIAAASWGGNQPMSLSP